MFIKKFNRIKLQLNYLLIKLIFQIDETDFYSFANEKIQNIIQNEGYKIDEIFNKKSLDCRVFGWFKSLYYLSSGKGSKSFSLKKENSEFSDLSKFVYSLSTSCK